MRKPTQIARTGEDDTVKLSVEDGTTMARTAQVGYTLHELVSNITPRNRHSETDWGGPAGHEEW